MTSAPTSVPVGDFLLNTHMINVPPHMDVDVWTMWIHDRDRKYDIRRRNFASIAMQCESLVNKEIMSRLGSNYLRSSDTQILEDV